jgi:hypothetical protein
MKEKEKMTSHFMFLAATRLSLVVWNPLSRLLRRYAPAEFLRIVRILIETMEIYLFL